MNTPVSKISEEDACSPTLPLPTSTSPAPDHHQSSHAPPSSALPRIPMSPINFNPPKPEHPMVKANALSSLGLFWLDHLLWKGSRQPLQDEDIYAVPPNHSSAVIREKVLACQAKYPDLEFGSLIIRTFLGRWLLGLCAMSSFVCCFLLQPFWVGSLLQFIADKSSGRYNEESTYFMGIHNGYGIAAGLVITSLIAILSINNTFYQQTRFGVLLRSAVLIFVYEKSMKLSPASRRHHTTGSIVTMMSVDAERVYQGVLTSQWSWAAPLVITVSIVLTIKVLGMSGVIGAALMTCFMFFQAYMASQTGVARDRLVTLTDERLKLTNEVLQGIRVVKLYCWEKPIREMIEQVRKQEILALGSLLLLKLCAVVVLFLAPVVVSVLTFTVYFMYDKDVKIDRVFTALAFMNLVRLPMSSLPNAVSNLADLSVAMKRINRFMKERELQHLPDSTTTVKPEDESEEIAGSIRLKGCDFTWADPSDFQQAADAVDSENGVISSPSNSQLTLKNINLVVQPGQLVAVIGPVGAGKSSLVSAILGEISCLRGQRHMKGKVAYVSQEAWIQNKTVRECVLFGRPYDRRKYRAAIKASQLRADLEILPAKDYTEIGERGINLSGGQKARVSLARALYDDADIFILDDPLAAVDAHVSRAIFDHAITGALHGKTRILVISSNYHLLPAADHIVIMEGGHILGCGSFNSLLPRFPQYLKTSDGMKSPTQEEGQAARDRNASSVGGMDEMGLSRANRASSAPIMAHSELIAKEDREVGSVSSSIYIEYFSGAAKSWTGGLLLACLILILFGVGQAMRVMVDLWLTKWATEAAAGDLSASSQLTYVGIYWLFCVLTVAFAFYRSKLVLWAAIQCSTTLHDRLLRGVLRAPVNTYFDVVPLGRILNRFSKDLDHVDQPLPETLLQLLQNGIFLLSILALCFSSSPWFILFFLPILLVFFVAYDFFRKTSREIKRLEGVSRSPIYSSFGEMLQGIPQIRAFRRTQDFRDRHYEAVDNNSSLFMLFWLTSRWLAIRLDILSVMIILVLAFIGVIMVESGSEAMISPSLLGLALIYGLQLTGLLQWTIRLVVETENNMTAVERLVSFLKLPAEAPEVIEEHRPPANWPTHGRIEIKNLSLRYREGLEKVLKGLTISIQSGEKVGLCGRTGAGKSTISQALFRMVEAEPGSSIEIDGIDIRSIGLNDLRSNLTVIPQDPVLFSGTLRFNLDPFNQCSDPEIWEALRRVYLDADVRALPELLEAPVMEKGENFSTGQKQLLCIGRALLRKSRIIIMDEATASVDTDTDRRIQETIRKNFGHCTILCVAHRLDTIIDHDKIAVLDKGQLVEYASPHQLLEQEGGYFHGLVAELGIEAGARLKEIAKASALSSSSGKDRVTTSELSGPSSFATARGDGNGGVVGELGGPTPSASAVVESQHEKEVDPDEDGQGGRGVAKSAPLIDGALVVSRLGKRVCFSEGRQRQGEGEGVEAVEKQSPEDSPQARPIAEEMEPQSQSNSNGGKKTSAGSVDANGRQKESDEEGVERSSTAAA